MADRDLGYVAFVLRMWEERGASAERAVWRFSLEDARTGERRGFASVEGLVTFLGAKMEPVGSAHSGDGEHPG